MVEIQMFIWQALEWFSWLSLTELSPSSKLAASDKRRLVRISESPTRRSLSILAPKPAGACTSWWGDLNKHFTHFLMPRSTHVKTRTHTGCCPGPRNALRLGPSFTKLLRPRKGGGVAFLFWCPHSGSKFSAESKKNLNLHQADKF